MDISNINYEPWKVIRLIGSGSFGAVYEIQREEFGEIYKAALKVISIPKSENEIRDNRADGMDEQSMTSYYSSVVKELTHEFSLLAKMMGNTNIVGYTDHKVIPHADGIGWDIYIRMELLTSLTEISSAYSFNRDQVIKLGIDICEALILCEKQNIIHRDIKPDNIFVSDNGDFKLGDFGIARTASRTMANMSRKGTPNYMAPEVYRDMPYNHTADIYSLGIVLYQLMNNKRLPFIPPNMTIQDREASLGRRMSGENLPKPESSDAELARIILKACAYEPSQRYMDAGEMKVDLLKALNGKLPQSLDMQEIMSKVKSKDIVSVNMQGSNGESAFGNQVNGNMSSYNDQENSSISSFNWQRGGDVSELKSQNSGNISTFGNQSSYQATEIMSELSNQANSFANQSASGESAKNDKKNKLPVIIGGGVAACVLIAIVTVAVLTLKGNGEDEIVIMDDEPIYIEETTKEEEAEKEFLETEEEELIEKETEETLASGNGSQLTEDLNDFIFELEGYTYKLPVSYQDFSSTGWKLYSYDESISEEMELAANDSTYITMTNGAVDIDITIYNASGNVKPIKDCNIGSIGVEAKDNLEFKIAKGITCRSTKEEVEDAFGTPSSSYDNDTYGSLTYRKGEYSDEGQTEFYLDKEHSVNNSIIITFMPATSDDITEVSDEVPEYILNYYAPSSITDNATDTIFELDGKLYQLPCPLSEFTDDGWKIASKDVDSIGALNKNSGSLRIEKDGYRIYLSMANFDKNARLIENCAVYGISLETSYKSDDMKGDYVKFSGGLNLDTKYEDADDKLKDFYKNDSDDYVSYNYDSTELTIYYYWSKDIDYPNMDISIRNEEWNY